MQVREVWHILLLLLTSTQISVNILLTFCPVICTPSPHTLKERAEEEEEEEEEEVEDHQVVIISMC